jgi:mannan endo-1,4-beta-mannosidase
LQFAVNSRKRGSRFPESDCRSGSAPLRRVPLIAAFTLMAIGALAFAQHTDAQQASGFVQSRGGKFVLDGAEFRVAGVNNHYLTYGTPKEVLAVLDDAVAMKANVVRTIVTPIIGSLDGRVPTIWNWQSRLDSSNLGVHSVYMVYWDPSSGSMATNEGPDGLERLDVFFHGIGTPLWG